MQVVTLTRLPVVPNQLSQGEQRVGSVKKKKKTVPVLSTLKTGLSELGACAQGKRLRPMNPLRLASGNQGTEKKIPRSGIRVCFSHSEEEEEAADGE